MKRQRWLPMPSRFNRREQEPWLALAALVCSALIYLVEARDARVNGYPISGFFLLPALLGMPLLRPRAEFTVAGLDLLLSLHALLFLHAGAIAPSFPERRFLVRLLALGICCWGSVMRARLEDATLLLRTIQAVSPVGMALMDRRRLTIVSANPAMGDLLDCPAADLAGTPWSDFDTDSDMQMMPLRRRLRCRNGGERHAEVMQRPLDGQGRFQDLVLICAIDRQQSVQDEQALLAKKEELRRKLVTSLEAAAMAHEIRQPLSFLMLECRRLQHQLECGQTANEELLLSIRQLVATATEMDATIRAMAALLRSVSTEHHWLDLASVVRSALKAQRVRLETLSVTLNTQGLDRPVPVIGDQTQLRIACTNLLSNALDAVQAGRASDRQLEVILENQAGRVNLVVADNGPGFGDRTVQDLVMRRSSKPGGMGLGLFISETIAAHHGGQLELGASSRLHGAEARLTLPTLPAPQPPRSGAESRPAPAPPRSAPASC